MVKLSMLNLGLITFLILFAFIIITATSYQNGYQEGYSDAKFKCLIDKAMGV